MNANRITYVPDPLSSNEPVTKQYGDRNYLTNAGFVMQDNIGMGGHTGLNGSLELYNNITFDGGAYCRDLNSSTSTGKEIVNKNTLETGHLITLQSLSPALSRLFQTAVKKELLVLKGET